MKLYFLWKKDGMEKFKQVIIIVVIALVALFLGTVLLKVLGVLISIGFYLTIIILAYLLIKKVFIKKDEGDDPRLFD